MADKSPEAQILCGRTAVISQRVPLCVASEWSGRSAFASSDGTRENIWLTRHAKQLEVKKRKSVVCPWMKSSIRLQRMSHS